MNIIRGGQGRNDKSMEAAASLILFCMCCGIVILLVAIFLNQ